MALYFPFSKLLDYSSQRFVHNKRFIWCSVIMVSLCIFERPPPQLARCRSVRCQCGFYRDGRTASICVIAGRTRGADKASKSLIGIITKQTEDKYTYKKKNTRPYEMGNAGLQPTSVGRGVPLFVKWRVDGRGIPFERCTGMQSDSDDLVCIIQKGWRTRAQ